MEKYCKFCGNKLGKNGLCNCDEAKAERKQSEVASEPAPANVAPTTSYYTAPESSGQQKQITSMVGMAKNAYFSFFKNPLGYIDEAPNRSSSHILAVFLSSLILQWSIALLLVIPTSPLSSSSLLASCLAEAAILAFFFVLLYIGLRMSHIRPRIQYLVDLASFCTIPLTIVATLVIFTNLLRSRGLYISLAWPYALFLMLAMLTLFYLEYALRPLVEKTYHRLLLLTSTFAVCAFVLLHLFPIW